MTSSFDSRLQTIRTHIDRAHQAYQAGDAAGCGWRARTATEAMLQVLCEVHDVEVPSTPASGSTLGTLRKALRHAKVLDRRMEDHVAHVQNIGNRAAHAQNQAELVVTLDDATTLLPALDQTWACFVDALPADLRPPASAPSPPGRSLWLTAAFALLAPVLSFGAMVTLLGWLQPTAPPVTEASPTSTFPDAEVLAEMLGEDPEPLQVQETPAPPTEVATAHIYAHAPLAAHVLDDLTCTDLQRVRNGVWASRGYVFSTTDAQSMFVDDPAYVARPDATRRALERLFTDVDKANLTTLDTVMRDRGCACPQPGRPRPCPE